MGGGDGLGGGAWWVTAGDRSVLASRGSKGGGSYRRDGGFTCPGMASGVTRWPMWGVGHTMTMCPLRGSPPSMGMVFTKEKKKGFQRKVCYLLVHYTRTWTLCILHLLVLSVVW